MVKLRRRRHPQTRNIIEVIDMREEEVPLLLNKIYARLNTPDECKVCRKATQYIRVQITNYTDVKTFKLCKSCLYRYT